MSVAVEWIWVCPNMGSTPNLAVWWEKWWSIIARAQLFRRGHESWLFSQCHTVRRWELWARKTSRLKESQQVQCVHLQSSAPASPTNVMASLGNSTHQKSTATLMRSSMIQTPNLCLLWLCAPRSLHTCRHLRNQRHKDTRKNQGNTCDTCDTCDTFNVQSVRCCPFQFFQCLGHPIIQLHPSTSSTVSPVVAWRCLKSGTWMYLKTWPPPEGSSKSRLSLHNLALSLWTKWGCLLLILQVIHYEVVLKCGNILHILKHPSALKSIENGDKGGPIDWFPARFLRNQKLNSNH